MRNGDFPPDRLEAQQQAVTLIVHCKLKSNPENTVGLLAMAGHIEVLTTLTQDNSKIFIKLHQLRINGESNFLAGIRVAHLALKHRQNRNHRTRIVVFVGSPINGDKSEYVRLAKKLKKEKVNVDVICFGEQEENASMLVDFVETLNGEEGTGSHLMLVPAGASLQDALIKNPIMRSDDGSLPVVTAMPDGGYDFGIDPNEDPELAMALRVSLEEQRQRQEQTMQQQTDSAAADEQGTNWLTEACPMFLFDRAFVFRKIH
ncbi:unnamed protein product [Soboliphyme baturini]|uniref:26S proteasome non-ATPase regulatory subunit 4 n=1 Tax=Soboliphyme baturini TaxID=241478 RepID=A0A183IY12_9BILA|nr:unnamed protein product [Soboliphyme baturini]